MAGEGRVVETDEKGIPVEIKLPEVPKTGLQMTPEMESHIAEGKATQGDLKFSGELEERYPVPGSTSQGTEVSSGSVISAEGQSKTFSQKIRGLISRLTGKVS